MRVNNLPKPLVAYCTLSLVYIILGLALPPNAPTVATYHLTGVEYRILTLFVNMPVILVWLSAFYGYAKLDEYVALIGSTVAGKSLATISNGLKFLAWGFPVTSIISTVLAAAAHNSSGLTSFTLIIVHYMSLVVAILAFTFISKGSRALVDIAQTRPSLEVTRFIFGSFSLLAVLFTYLTIHMARTTQPSPFRMPLWLILFTIIIPYLYAWSMGLFAAYEIFLYSKQTKGLLYRRALTYLSGGLVITIISSVVLQYVQSDTTRIRRISFNLLFVGVYLLLLVYAFGFLLIGKGARRLKRIEEV